MNLDIPFAQPKPKPPRPREEEIELKQFLRVPRRTQPLYRARLADGREMLLQEVEEPHTSTSYTNADVQEIRLKECLKISYYQALMADGKKLRLRRVSTILDNLSKGRGYDQWVANAVVQACRERIFPGQRWTQPQLEAIYGIAVRAHDDERDTAADHGTRAHDLIEGYLRTNEFCTYNRKTGEFQEVDLPSEAIEVQNSFGLWLEWWTKMELRVVDVEKYVYDVRHKYAGTLDFLTVLPTGELFVWDWKTSKKCRDKYLLQVVAYVGALIEMGYKRPAGAAILRCGREDAAFQVVPVPREQWALYYRAFLALNMLQDWKNEASAHINREHKLWVARDAEARKRLEAERAEREELTQEQVDELFEGFMDPSGQLPLRPADVVEPHGEPGIDCPF